MNNTTRGEAVRAIMSRKYDNADEKLMEVYFNSHIREIERHIAGLEVNAKNTSTWSDCIFIKNIKRLRRHNGKSWQT